MSDQDSASHTALRDKLLALKKELSERTAKVKRNIYSREEPLSQDFSEQAVETENFDVLEGLYEEGRYELSLIDIALKRMDDGSYGICEKCGEEISAPRLEAVPYAVRCIKCAD